MEHTAPDGSSRDSASAEEREARTTRATESACSDGRVLTALAEIDSNLRESDCAWKAVVRKLDACRQEPAVAAVQLQRFEARLTEAETRRVALHGETERLRHRKQAALRQLSAPVRSAYEAAFQAGRVPTITTVASGVCSGCASRLPSAVVEAVGHGAVAICGGCARLLCPTEAR